ncbi:MAG: hypothetical protein NVV70_03670 [Cellulomonas sp.]|nr:hypothetical protein [Cellulomonas sp.]MCR6647266.1 hypothetical protein [Cellulomonas sp.]
MGMEIVVRASLQFEGASYLHTEDINYEVLTQMAARALRDLPIGDAVGVSWSLAPITADIRPEPGWGSQVHLRNRRALRGSDEGACGRAGSAELTETLAFVTCTSCRGSGPFEAARHELYKRSQNVVE